MAWSDYTEISVGGSIAYPSGGEVSITATATLTAGAHGGKTLEICATNEDQMITLFSAVGITTKQRRVGIKVSPKSKRVKIYNAGTSGTDQILELWLEPGAEGTLYANALTVLGDWQWFGKGNIRNMVARRKPVSLDLGGAIATGSTGYRHRACFITGASAFAIVTAMTASVSIHAVIGTFTADKTITLGTLQTVRDTANTMANPVVGAASGGGLVFGWRETTTPKTEIAGATVSGTTISVGTVVDVNATTTVDINSAGVMSIIPDYSTANQMWMIGPSAGGSCLTVMSLSGNTVTVDGDNVETGLSQEGMIYSPAANKCLCLSRSTIIFVNYYQYSAGAVSSVWSHYTGHDTVTGNDGIIGMSPEFFFARVRTNYYICKTDQTDVTNTQLLATTSLYNSADLALNPITYSVPVDDRALLMIGYDFTSYINDFRKVFVDTDDATKDSRPQAVLFSHTLANVGSSLQSFNINPTTKDVVVAYSQIKTVGGNSFLYVNLFEVPRN